MYALSHSGLGQVEDSSPVELSSGVIVIGLIALLTLMFMSNGKDEFVFERSPKGRAKGKRVKAQAQSDYASYVSRKHKLSKEDEQYLREHDE